MLARGSPATLTSTPALESQNLVSLANPFHQAALILTALRALTFPRQYSCLLAATCTSITMLDFGDFTGTYRKIAASSYDAYYYRAAGTDYYYMYLSDGLWTILGAVADYPRYRVSRDPASVWAVGIAASNPSFRWTFARGLASRYVFLTCETVVTPASTPALANFKPLLPSVQGSTGVNRSFCLVHRCRSRCAPLIPSLFARAATWNRRTTTRHTRRISRRDGPSVGPSFAIGTCRRHHPSTSPARVREPSATSRVHRQRFVVRLVAWWPCSLAGFVRRQ